MSFFGSFGQGWGFSGLLEFCWYVCEVGFVGFLFVGLFLYLLVGYDFGFLEMSV